MANKSPLSIPSIGSSSSRTPSPLPKDVTQAIAAAATTVDESSESENETEPARIFQRRVSTTKTLNGSVSNFHNAFPSLIFHLFHEEEEEEFFFEMNPKCTSLKINSNRSHKTCDELDETGCHGWCEITWAIKQLRIWMNSHWIICWCTTTVCEIWLTASVVLGPSHKICVAY